MINQKRPPVAETFCGLVLEDFQQREMARAILKLVDSKSGSGLLAYRILIKNTVERTKRVRAHILGGE